MNPDVLFIMEIGELETLLDLQNRLLHAGCHLPFHEWVRGADTHRHIALLTRLPILSKDSQNNVPFVLGGKPQLVARGFLDVTLDAGWLGPVRILGAHLKSRRVVPDFDQAQFRLREATLLRQKIDKALAAHPDLKLIVLGDFNDLKNSPPIRTLIGSPGTPQSLADITLRDCNGETWTHYWKPADEYSRIDYIFLSQSLLPFLNTSRSAIAYPPNWELASDHRPIYITLQPPDLSQ